MATNILFLYDNKINSATLVASSEAVGFPASNLKNPFRTKVWRTVGVVPGTATLDIDLGAGTVATTCVALIGYSWAAAPGTLQLLFDDDPAYGSIDHTETLTWAANPTANGNYAAIIKTFTSKDERYLRLNVVNAPGDWDLAKIFVGTYFTPTYNYAPAWSGNYIDESMGARTIGGQDHFDEIGKYREFGFSFRVDSQSQWESFQQMFLAVGRSKDIFVAMDYDNEPNEMTIYGKLSGLPAMTAYVPWGFDINFTLTESR